MEKTKEEALRWSFEDLVCDDGLFVVDSDQRVVAWSDSAERITGYAARDIVGRLCYEVIRGRDAYNYRFCRANCPVIQNARRGRPTPNYDLVCLCPDGRERYLNMSVAVLRDGRSVKVLHLFRDVTERRKTEEFARKASSALRRLFEDATPEGEADGQRDVPLPRLSRREAEVLRLLAAGMTTRQIAEVLHVRPVTARNHVTRVLNKLGVDNRLQAVVYASRHGLI